MAFSAILSQHVGVLISKVIVPARRQAGFSVLLKILLELNQRETSEPAQVIVIYPVGWRIFSHGGNILEVIKVVFMKFDLWIVELLNTLALIHNVGFVVADAKVIYF